MPRSTWPAALKIAGKLPIPRGYAAAPRPAAAVRPAGVTVYRQRAARSSGASGGRFQAGDRRGA